MPILILNPDLLKGWGIGEVVLIMVVILTVGYLLDIAGAYGWSQAYRKNREEYFRNVAKIIYPVDPTEDGSDVKSKATIVLARFWARCPEDYQSLIEEPRAKWVLTLQSAFICRLSGSFWGSAILVELILYLLYQSGPAVHNPWNLPIWAFFLIEAVLCAGSWLLGKWLVKRGLYLAELSDTTAITLLTDRRDLLADDYSPKE